MAGEQGGRRRIRQAAIIVADTIVAKATAAGRGAVGIIRVSGTQVPRIAAEILGTLPVPRVAHLAKFLDADGRTLDQGLALYFCAPASFTGEPVLELQGHGGALVMDMLLQRVLALGGRMARPGEFSERAFLNGKIDIAQAEAVADLIDAATTAAARAAARSMEGEFSVRIRALQRELTDVRVHVEAHIDFPDEEIDVQSRVALTARLSHVSQAFDSIKEAARQGALLRDGLTVVIAGKPNAGKSSLLNRLVGGEVAIVTELPGTTRDLLRHHLQLDGLPLNVVDTAGLRTATDIVELEGIRRGRAEMERADRILYVLDASLSEQHSLAAELAALPADVPVTVVVNKIDLAGQTPGAAYPGTAYPGESGLARIFVSARTGEGLAELRVHLKNAAGYREADSGALSARRRHLDALERAHALVQAAAAALTELKALELSAEDLRLAQRALGEITGEFTSEDLLGEIFGSFCIGK